MLTLAEQLMAGPRGRELCLLAACFADESVSRAHRMVEARLESGVTGGWYAPGGIRSAPGSEEAVSRLAYALADVTVIGDHWIHLALETTVEGAMYWQEPWSVSASLPELAAELHRIAALIAASPTAQWWTAEQDPVQFETRFLPIDHVAATTSSAADTLAEQRAKTVAAEVRTAAQAAVHPRMAVSGEWWSVPSFGLIVTASAPGGAPSSLYLVEDGYGQTRATVHRASVQDPRVCEIDSAAVWAALCRGGHLEVTASMRGCWYSTTGLADTRWVMPDWSAVAQEYDAVHLQVGAYLAASGTAIEVEPGVHSVIAGWAPGDTYWLTDVAEVDPVGRIFVKDQDDDLWHPTEETA